MREKRNIAVVFLLNLCLLAGCGNDTGTWMPAAGSGGQGSREGGAASGVPDSADDTPVRIPSVDVSDILAQAEREKKDSTGGAYESSGVGGIPSGEPDSLSGNPPGDPDGLSGNLPGEAGSTPGNLSGEAGGASVEATGSAVPEEPAEVRITISAAGDVTMGNYLGQGFENSFRQTYEQGVGDSYFFENVLDIFSADDMTLVNLEGPLTRSDDPREGPVYCISGDPEYVNILTEGSVEAVSMGNNHRLDYKEKGSDDTAAALEEAGIPYAYDDVYCMYEAKGVRIGIVSVNEVSQGATVEKYIKDGIEQLRGEGADLVLTCCHWGVEREYYPEDYQKSLGRKCIDWGADLVIGHHPHVLQGVEEYQGRFIVYSLGNFCFGANRNPSDKDCMIFQQTFTFLDGEKQEDKEVRVIPCSISSVSGRNDYKPTPAAGDEAQRILDRINEYSADFGVEFDSEGGLKLPNID